jgi:hypothetical protein
VKCTASDTFETILQKLFAGYPEEIEGGKDSPYDHSLSFFDTDKIEAGATLLLLTTMKPKQDKKKPKK